MTESAELGRKSSMTSKTTTTALNKVNIRNLAQKPKGEQLMPWSHHLAVSDEYFKESDCTKSEARTERNLDFYSL